MNTRDKRALFFGAVVIGVAVLFRVALSPGLDRWREARATAGAQSAMLEQFESKLDDRDKFRKRLEPRFGPGVHDSLRSADEARVDFPRAVQEALSRGGVAAQQVEVQGTRRVRDLPGVELLSLRVQVNCQPPSIPSLFRELSRADVPVLIESITLSMPQRGQRQNWQATLVLSTPTRREARASRL